MSERLVKPEFGPVREFQGDYRFLSNMWKINVPIQVQEWEVDTSEHAYQMSKFANDKDRELIALSQSGIAAKRKARRLLRSGAERTADWEEKKLGTMLYYVVKKFELNEDLSSALIETEDRPLIEGNNWDDTYWGVCPPGSENGTNYLGRILMHVRENLRSGMLAGLSESVQERNFVISPKEL